MQVIELANKDKETYNIFVAENGGSFLQSVEWGDWQTQNGRPANRYMITDNEQDTIIAAQLLKYSLPLGQYYLYCPYGPIGKWKVESGKWKEAMQALIEAVKENHPKALFIKFEPQALLPELYPLPFLSAEASAKKDTLYPTSRIQPASTLILDLTLHEDELLAQMHKKTRYDIRIATKHGVSVTAVDDVTAEDAIKLIAHTEERQNYKGHNQEYYNSLVTFFKNNDVHGPKLSIFIAKHGTHVLSSGIFIDFAGTRTYLFGGSSMEHREVMPAYALHWYLIQDAKKQGLKKYDFWGIETSSGTTPGFVRFKLGFGGEPVHYPSPTNVSWQPLKYRAYRLAKKILR